METELEEEAVSRFSHILRHAFSSSFQPLFSTLAPPPENQRNMFLEPLLSFSLKLPDGRTGNAPSPPRRTRTWTSEPSSATRPPLPCNCSTPPRPMARRLRPQPRNMLNNPAEAPIPADPTVTYQQVRTPILDARYHLFFRGDSLSRG